MRFSVGIYRLGWATCLIALLAGVSCEQAGHNDVRSSPVEEARQRLIGATPKYTLFESGHVRPLALSPDGARLFAVNTPDARLEVFEITGCGLQHAGSIPVGLEPVAVAARTNNEVWVVNHLSDSVSIVTIKNKKPRVTRTLLVGDEPRDIVFAGPGRSRAFITTAHRGQNSPVDPQLTTPGVGRADVWVFDSGALGTSLGGTPLAILTFFADTPRALATTSDGSRVYVAAFNSGNKTTTIHQQIVPDVGGRPPPNVNHELAPERSVGLIVKHDGAHWVDSTGRVWDHNVAFSLPDKDVFAIDALATPPEPAVGPGSVYTGVGTTLFNMAVNPVSGKVYVSNTEARNDQRFEGEGNFSMGETLRGHFVESRISVLDGAGGVAPRHLNKHIHYSSCCAPNPSAENARSMASPLEMAISSDGATLYVAALGSNEVGVLDTQALEQDTFVPDVASQIPVTGGGPTGLVLDEPRGRLYVLTRLDNGISEIDTATGLEISHHVMYSPEPASVVAGRRFLYDASYTSSHGDSACASCHTFGDTDHLAWDLGDPDGDVVKVPGPYFPFKLGADDEFHPMKGPMATQSLRGMANHGAMHWRGDRTGGYTAPSAQPDQGSWDEDAAFKQFNPAFVGLLGRATELTAAEMQAFTDFALQITYPPNPIRALDNSLTVDQQIGKDIFENEERTLSGVFPPGFKCSQCHIFDRDFNAEHGVPAPGIFGSSGLYVVGGGGQVLKVPHLRNMYQKVGMFGMVTDPLANPYDSGAFTGDQIRGFGFVHDGSMDTIFRFHGQLGFIQDMIVNPTGFARSAAGALERRRVEAFILAADSNLAPIVGQQVTLTNNNSAVASPRIDLLLARAALGECELVASGHIAQAGKSWLYDGQAFVPDRANESPLSAAALRALAALPGREITYTCVPIGSGLRVGLDRDLDGVLNRDE